VDRTQWNPEMPRTSKLALMYYPEYPYEEVQPGVTFTVREGPLVVGYGVIQSRGMESFPLPVAQAQ